MRKRKGNKAEAIKHRVEHTVYQATGCCHPPVPLPVSEWKFGTSGSSHASYPCHSLLKGETPFLSFHLLLPQFCSQLIFLLMSPPAFSSVGAAQLPRSTNHNVHKTVFLFPTAFSRSLLLYPNLKMSLETHPDSLWAAHYSWIFPTLWLRIRAPGSGSLFPHHLQLLWTIPTSVRVTLPIVQLLGFFDSDNLTILQSTPITIFLPYLGCECELPCSTL